MTTRDALTQRVTELTDPFQAQGNRLELERSELKGITASLVEMTDGRQWEKRAVEHVVKSGLINALMDALGELERRVKTASKDVIEYDRAEVTEELSGLYGQQSQMRMKIGDIQDQFRHQMTKRTNSDADQRAVADLKASLADLQIAQRLNTQHIDAAKRKQAAITADMEKLLS